jgi:hypothetical protein
MVTSKPIKLLPHVTMNNIQQMLDIALDHVQTNQDRCKLEKIVGTHNI